MNLTDRVVVITGGAGGIGAALGRRFAAEGAAAVVLADLAADAARATAEAVGSVATGVGLDVTDEAAVRALVDETERRHGRIDLFCANAGVATGGGIDAPDADWDRAWQVNVLGHLHSARAVLPGMLSRGQGHLLLTCSAAGLLTAVGDAPYTATKHAAVGLAEWLAITYRDAGIRVSALCPQGVDTPMLADGLTEGHLGARVIAASGTILTPDQVADAVIAGLAEERFLILPHPEVADYARRRAEDPDGWQAGLRKLVRKLRANSATS
ncbi:SDR family oxidoreductase [Micromonospora echinospora]|uniref:NAD(P)-dependent dehydrogenase (Short-subunit alcohol dehydrogenase family) n=1 Tax=Micromonospora echinospora TaxID=1877 RepID=A0ABR6MHU2_MICEC|nr:SDR family oxidoreductase [Micromonospora echinospora]MBB5114939.1 NAD(P)-dependent dehydrogenase (short-subunit alcohol dehydrogenase family) [Micromonospora echinospora]